MHPGEVDHRELNEYFLFNATLAQFGVFTFVLESQVDESLLSFGSEACLVNVEPDA